jgi:deoxyribose-phosphate aldolase
MNSAGLASLIDHTILRPDATGREVIAVCREAIAHRFHAVCVNPRFVPLVALELRGSGVVTCSVMGFPLGASTTAMKRAEAAEAIAAGAREIDMVMAIGALKDGRTIEVRDEIAAVKATCGEVLLKVIIETCLLSDQEKVVACELSRAAGADFVKTSTGFAKAGATVGDVALMRRTVGDAMGVKAAGGIGSVAAATAMIAAGASRIGTSSGVKLVAL